MIDTLELLSIPNTIDKLDSANYMLLKTVDGFGQDYGRDLQNAFYIIHHLRKALKQMDSMLQEQSKPKLKPSLYQ